MATNKIYPTYRVSMTAEEVRAFKQWALDNDTSCAAALAKYIRKLIKPKEITPRAVGESGARMKPRAIHYVNAR